MENTKLDYLEDTYLFDTDAKLLSVENYEGEKLSLILDHTIMYPQAGGQPYDTGEISQQDLIFIVTEVRFKDSKVYHIGHFGKENFITGEVHVHINEERRKLHAQIHTAGHLVDDALYSFGYNKDLTPLKGYHYPDGPYIEYVGELAGDLQSIAKELENKVNEIIATDYQTHAEIVSSLDDLKKCLYVPSHIPEGKPIRIVYASAPDKGQPCGGTHVKHLLQVGKVIIPKIKVKQGNTRISYQLADGS